MVTAPEAPVVIPPAYITAVILAGGRGSRMGGLDKGLQLFNGVPLVLHALKRLQPQVGSVVINANRNLAAYQSFGVPVVTDPDGLDEFAGPLAGVQAALQHCSTPYLLTVPCDAPLFPVDLAVRLAAALAPSPADIAVAASLDSNATLREQSVFCLIRVETLASLVAYTAAGGRKVSSWTTQHRVVQVPFNLTGDDANAFFNANTLAALEGLHSQIFKARTH